MNYDTLRRMEKKYADWLSQVPFFAGTKVELNENKKYALWIMYRKGMTTAIKKEIATELGDIQLKFFMIDE